MKLCTHDLYANVQKRVEQIFEILFLKCLANFLNFNFGLEQWSCRGQHAFSSIYAEQHSVTTQPYRLEQFFLGIRLNQDFVLCYYVWP